jgi:hypothetical protein
MIDPSGRLKDMSFSPTRTCHQLLVTYAHEKDGPIGGESRKLGVVRVRLTESEIERGSKLLRDHYREWHEQSKKSDKSAVLASWNLWCDYHSRCHDDERRATVARKTFPENHLPPSVLELQRVAAELRVEGEWMPDSPSLSADLGLDALEETTGAI